MAPPASKGYSHPNSPHPSQQHVTPDHMYPDTDATKMMSYAPTPTYRSSVEWVLRNKKQQKYFPKSSTIFEGADLGSPVCFSQYILDGACGLDQMTNIFPQGNNFCQCRHQWVIISNNLNLQYLFLRKKNHYITYEFWYSKLKFLDAWPVLKKGKMLLVSGNDWKFGMLHIYLLITFIQSVFVLSSTLKNHLIL